MMAGMILISFALLGASFITLSYQYTVATLYDRNSRCTYMLTERINTLSLWKIFSDRLVFC